MFAYQYENPPAYGSPHTDHLPPPYHPASPRRYGDPVATTPERLPVKTSTLVRCGTCRKQVWTEIQRTRGGLERNGLTDTLFNAVAVMVVSYDTNYRHFCPDCGRKFQVYRLIRHMGKHDRRISNATRPAPEIIVDGRRQAMAPPYQSPRRISADSMRRTMPADPSRRDVPDTAREQESHGDVEATQPHNRDSRPTDEDHAEEREKESEGNDSAFNHTVFTQTVESSPSSWPFYS